MSCPSGNRSKEGVGNEALQGEGNRWPFRTPAHGQELLLSWQEKLLPNEGPGEWQNRPLSLIYLLSWEPRGT